MTSLEFNNDKILFVDGKIALDSDCCCGDCDNCSGAFTGIKVTASFTNGTCTSCSGFNISNIECPAGTDACCGYGTGCSSCDDTVVDFSGDCRGSTYDHCYTYVSWALVVDNQATPHYWMIIDMGTVYDTGDIPYEIYTKDLGTSKPDCTSTTIETATKVTDCSSGTTQYPSGTLPSCASACDRRNGNCTFPGSVSWSFY